MSFDPKKPKLVNDRETPLYTSSICGLYTIQDTVIIVKNRIVLFVEYCCFHWTSFFWDEAKLGGWYYFEL